MKVYVLGDDRESVIRLSNFINSAGSTAIISETVSSDYTALVEDLLDDKGRHTDLAVVISKQPIEASIEANRSGKFRAVVCRNKREAAKARKAHANVIVLDRGDLEDDGGGDIIEGWLGAEERGTEDEEVPEPKQANRPDTLKHLFSFANRKPARKKRNNTEREEEEEPEDEEIPKPKGKGIIDNIKYTFGIE